MEPDHLNMNGEIKAELDRIEGRISTLSEQKGEGRFWKILQILLTITLCLLTAVIIPWGVWVTKSIQDGKIEQRAINDWRALGPRFTPADGDKLRLQTKDEVRIEVGAKLDSIIAKQDALGSEMRASINSLKDVLMKHVLNP